VTDIQTVDPPRVYLRAAEIIETQGWVQGKNIGSEGERCLGAAINQAADRSLFYLSDDLFGPFAHWLLANRRDQIVAAIALVIPVGLGRERLMSGVFRSGDALWLTQKWNDVHRTGISTRTKDEVLAALRAVAADLRTAGEPQ
jgi:hypothetical protein